MGHSCAKKQGIGPKTGKNRHFCLLLNNMLKLQLDDKERFIFSVAMKMRE
jgi:hypothetical protein